MSESPAHPTGQYLVTGATGFLGAHVVRALLGRGYPVSVLARDRGGASAAERIDRLVTWLGIGEDRRRLTVITGDVTAERFGLSETAWAGLAADVDRIIHCAACTRFGERSRAELERVNVGGTERALELAAAGRIRSFHLLSTAYVAGCVEGRVEETWHEPPAFTNPYEETKHRSEQAARRAAAALGMPLSIYRPTIVHGDSQSGRSLLFNALYHPVRALLLLRDILVGDLRRGGQRASASGIAELPDGWLRLPLRIASCERATLNLIPVDYFADAFLALLDASPTGGIFHIASDETVSLETLIDHASRLYQLRGLEAIPETAFSAQPPSALERLFASYIAAYRPYMRDCRHFDSSTSRPLLEAAGVHCPRFTYASFARLMRYAEAVDWGKRALVSVTQA